METFSEYSKEDWQLTNDGSRIEKINRGQWCTCYGARIISKYNKQIHQWTIKIISVDHKFVVIGIDEALHKWKMATFYNIPLTKSYSIYGRTGNKFGKSGKKQEYDQGKFDNGDTILMILNMAKRTLSFGVNGKSPTKAFDVEPSDIGYCLAVCMCYEGNSVEILSYEAIQDEDEKQNVMQNEVQQLKVKQFIQDFYGIHVFYTKLVHLGRKKIWG